MSERSPEADIELSCVNVAEEHGRAVFLQQAGVSVGNSPEI
jgi:hypothetical protein